MRTMRRATRTARSVPNGKKILDLLSSKENLAKLERAASAGIPPVTAISDKLIETVGSEDASLRPVKQFVGLCIRALLEAAGYEVAERGVRVSNDPLFRTGTTYQIRQVDLEAAPLLERIIDVLTEQEVDRALRLLRDRKSKFV